MWITNISWTGRDYKETWNIHFYFLLAHFKKIIIFQSAVDTRTRLESLQHKYALINDQNSSLNLALNKRLGVM